VVDTYWVLGSKPTRFLRTAFSSGTAAAERSTGCSNSPAEAWRSYSLNIPGKAVADWATARSSAADVNGDFIVEVKKVLDVEKYDCNGGETS